MPKLILGVVVLMVIVGVAYAGTGFYCGENGPVKVRVVECVADGTMTQNGYSGKLYKVSYKSALVIQNEYEYPDCPIGYRHANSDEESDYGIDVLRKNLVKEACRKKLGFFK